MMNSTSAFPRVNDTTQARCFSGLSWPPECRALDRASFFRELVEIPNRLRTRFVGGSLDVPCDSFRCPCVGLLRLAAPIPTCGTDRSNPHLGQPKRSLQCPTVDGS